MTKLCQSKTLRLCSGQASSQVKPSQKKNSKEPPPPASRSTSPKYDGVNFESAFRLFLVVFGGGRVGADFYCHKAGLVIEVDGDIHDLQKEEDARREKVLSEMGLRVVRFGNEEVERNLARAIAKINELVSLYN